MNDVATPIIFEREGCPLHYWLSGPADRPCVVFTHGVMMDHRIFDEQVAYFSKGYRVLTWDVRGHGRSRPVGADFSVRQAARDLLAILDYIECPRAVLVGHSMGGLISQEAAFLNCTRIAGLAMVGIVDLTHPVPPPFRFGKTVVPWFFGWAPDFLIRFFTGIAAGEKPSTRKTAREVSRVLSRTDRIRFWTAIMHGFHAEPDYQISLPLLLTHGRSDCLVGFGEIPRHMRKWANRHPVWRYQVIPQAGHNAHQDNPDFFNPLLLEFLQDVFP